MFAEFINTYGMEILGALFTALAGFLGLVAKNLYANHINDETKKSVCKTVVGAIEQIYRDLHGEDKLSLALEAASDMLADKGITATNLELRMLIESAVSEFNHVFENGGKAASTEE